MTMLDIPFLDPLILPRLPSLHIIIRPTEFHHTYIRENLVFMHCHMQEAINHGLPAYTVPEISFSKICGKNPT